MSENDGRTPAPPNPYGFGIMPNIHPGASGASAPHQPAPLGGPSAGAGDAGAAPSSAGAAALRRVEEVGEKQARMRALIADAHNSTRQAAAALASGADASAFINRTGRLLEELSAALGR